MIHFSAIYNIFISIAKIVRVLKQDRYLLPLVLCISIAKIVRVLKLFSSFIAVPSSISIAKIVRVLKPVVYPQ